MSKLKIQNKKSLHLQYFISKDEIPADSKFPYVVYEKPKRILIANSISKTNYQSVSKLEAVNNLVYQWHIEEGLRRELAHERIRNNILARRMIESGLDSTLTLDEIKEYEESYATAIKDTIDVIMEEAPRGIREEIFTRVRNEMSKVSESVKNEFDYNIFRLNVQLKYLDSLMSDVMGASDKRISLKDKTAIMTKLGKEQRECAKSMKELLETIGVNLKELGKTSDVVKNEEEVSKYGTGGINLSNMLKK